MSLRERAGILQLVQLGEVVGGRFVLERLAGTGGMGAVFRAHDRETGEPVAVKVLAQHDTEAIRRFDHEARVLAELGHPNIVKYVAHGTTDVGAPYLVMEWLSGQSLAARLAQGRLSLEDALSLARSVASALASAHARGIVHRDIKPSNVFLVEGSASSAKVLDFGLAQAAPGATRLTRTGSVVGTPGYMAPEQARGSRGRLNSRADVFSLGALLFECLAGKPAFEGDGVMAILARLLLEDAPRVKTYRSDVPDALDALVARLLSRVPELRPADGAEVLRALETIDTSGFVSTTPERTTMTIGERENRLVCAVVAAPIAEAVTSPSSPTLRTELPRESWEEVRRIAARFGAPVSELSSGAIFVVLDGGADMSVNAAKCALAIADVLTGFRVALVSGRSEATGEVLASEVLERAVAELELSRRAGAGPGVRVDERTRTLLNERFVVYGAPGSYRLRGERDDLGEPRALLGRPSPFIGRKRELSTLVDLFEEGESENQAKAAHVVAPAGFGKTRLAQEVVASLRSRRSDLLVAVGRPDVSGLSFGAIASVFHSMARLPFDAPADAKRDALLDLAKGAGARAPEVVASFVEEIRRLGASGLASLKTSSTASLRDALFDLLVALGRSRPFMLVLEDALWWDEPSLDLVEEALSELDARPFGVLALSRTQGNERGAGLFRKRRVEEMRLGALPPRASRDLLKRALGALVTDADLDALVKRALGVPFFLEELARAAADRRVDLTPEALLSVHGPDIAALAPDERRVLRAAALIGVTFWEGAVLSLLGEKALATRTRRILGDLVLRELITRRRTSHVSGDVEYSFTRPMVREAFLATLTAEDRRRGHTRAEEWRERSGIRYKATIAEGSSRIYSAGPPSSERGGS